MKFFSARFFVRLLYDFLRIFLELSISNLWKKLGYELIMSLFSHRATEPLYRCHLGENYYSLLKKNMLDALLWWTVGPKSKPYFGRVTLYKRQEWIARLSEPHWSKIFPCLSSLSRSRILFLFLIIFRALRYNFASTQTVFGGEIQLRRKQIWSEA